MNTAEAIARQAAARATKARALRAPTYKPSAERCPECGRGRVTPTQHVGNPEAIQYVCSRRCGWDA